MERSFDETADNFGCGRQVGEVDVLAGEDNRGADITPRRRPVAHAVGLDHAGKLILAAVPARCEVVAQRTALQISFTRGFM